MSNDYKTYSKEIHKKVIRKFDRRQVFTSYTDDIWCADLLDMSNLKNKNKKITFLLTVMDIFSRYAWVIPLKKKSEKEVLEGFKSIGHFPVNLWTDEGKEFYNKSFKELCREAHINLYHTFSGLKSVFIERFNRTIKLKIYQHLDEFQTEKYLDVLPELVATYNDTVNSSTGQTPNAIYLDHKLPTKKVTITPDTVEAFKVGDFVRISKQKGLFEKGYTHNYSKEVFKVKSVDTSDTPITYELEDQMDEKIDGQFYKQELLKTEIPHFKVFNKVEETKTENKKKKYLVSFQGHGNKFNQWVDETELKKLKRKD